MRGIVSLFEIVSNLILLGKLKKWETSQSFYDIKWRWKKSGHNIKNFFTGKYPLATEEEQEDWDRGVEYNRRHGNGR